jgi:hypothetical protein
MGSLGVQRYLSNLTTNQKVAGSSPAERAPKSPKFAGKSWSTKQAPAKVTMEMDLLGLRGYIDQLVGEMVTCCAIRVV